MLMGQIVGSMVLALMLTMVLIIKLSIDVDH